MTCSVSSPLRSTSWAGKALNKLATLGDHTATDRLRTLCGFSGKLFAFKAQAVKKLVFQRFVIHDLARDTVSLTAEGRYYLGLPDQPAAHISAEPPAPAPAQSVSHVAGTMRAYKPPARLLPRAESLALLNSPSLFGGARIERQSVLGQ